MTGPWPFHLTPPFLPVPPPPLEPSHLPGSGVTYIAFLILGFFFPLMVKSIMFQYFLTGVSYNK